MGKCEIESACVIWLLFGHCVKFHIDLYFNLVSFYCILIMAFLCSVFILFLSLLTFLFLFFCELNPFGPACTCPGTWLFRDLLHWTERFLWTFSNHLKAYFLAILTACLFFGKVLLVRCSSENKVIFHFQNATFARLGSVNGFYLISNKCSVDQILLVQKLSLVFKKVLIKRCKSKMKITFHTRSFPPT